MLEPRDRSALLEALRPPPGYTVDAAIATTYSLDLTALLTAPLAFSLYDRLAARDRNEPAERLDSFALLHAVRQHAERMVVFCQAGCTKAPSRYRQLFAYLEEAVVPVCARAENGVFHPKLWIERLICEESPVRYRVLCLSRNLTFDQSWDTMLVLDGELADRKLAIGESKPLGEFVDALPALAVNPLTPARARIVDMMSDELRRVRFDIPEGFESFRFWPLGHDGKRRNPFGDTRVERLLVISPFLSAGRLAKLAEEGKKHVLVSRLEELQTIPRDVLAMYSELHVLHDAAEDVDGDATPESDETVTCGVQAWPPGKGLHAKLYVADDGWNAHVWTGSANASDAGFELNVEFLVQLTGRKSAVGVQRTLNGDGDNGLAQILGPFNPPETPVVQSDTDERLAEILRLANQRISKTRWSARIQRTSGEGEPELYTAILAPTNGAVLRLPDACTVQVWPIALPADRARPLTDTCSAMFERCSFMALTSFFAFEVAATVGDSAGRQAFVLRVPLEGVPEDRTARVLHALLDEPGKVLRFLRLLLSTDAFDAMRLLDGEGDDDDPGDKPRRSEEHIALFESLVRMLDRDPRRLVEVDRLVRELRARPDAATRLLPPGFEDVWNPIWAAYQSLPRREGTS